MIRVVSTHSVAAVTNKSAMAGSALVRALPGLDRGLALVELLFGRPFFEEARELLVHHLLHAV